MPDLLVKDVMEMFDNLHETVKPKHDRLFKMYREIILNDIKKNIPEQEVCFTDFEDEIRGYTFKNLLKCKSERFDTFYDYIEYYTKKVLKIHENSDEDDLYWVAYIPSLGARNVT